MKKKYAFDLQLFAEEGDGAGADGSNGAGSVDGESTGAQGADTGAADGKSHSFDDFLKEGKNQAEFDRRIQQAIQTATTGLEDKYRVLMDNKVSEAEKLSKMSKDERAAYETKKREEEFETRVSEFEKEKLLVAAKEDLQKQSLPIVFAESLVAISDASKIKEAISELKKSWDAEITEAIKAKARQSTPTEGGRSGASQVDLSDIGEMARKNRIIK